MADKILKFLRTLDLKLQEKVKARLLALKKNPFEGGDIKKLQGERNQFRLRFGKIRIIFTVNKQKKVTIIDVNWRGSVY